MPDIQLLDEATIEKIAAGEVVERPSSVAKELVENAIDARATFITVEIKEGGTTFLRVTDNGCGIEKEQVKLAFLRHSTSKIRSMEDLLRVKSLGFRGEALSSISAVAQVELITRPRGALTGVRYVIEGSKEKLFEEIGAPEGTTFLVRNLFFNTPVRRRFLKSAQTEGGYIAAVMERLALSHPEISFQLIVNNQPKLHTSGNCNRKDMIFHIYGKEIASNLLSVDGERDGIRLAGFIGKPVISRGNRNFENYFVNGRYLKSQIIAGALEEAYKPYLMSRQYPFTVLYITMDEELLDVNVHPTKMEARFSQGEQLYRSLSALVRETLAGRDLVVEVSADAPVKKDAAGAAFALPEPFEKKRLSDMKERAGGTRLAESAYEKKYAPRPLTPDADNMAQRGQPQKASVQGQRTLRQAQPDAAPEQPEQAQSVSYEAPRQTTLSEVLSEENGYQAGFIEQAKRGDVRIIGQLFDTYWLTQAGEQLFVIDQHAAHEKVLYERMMKRFANRELTSQQLSPPIVLSLTVQEQSALKDHAELIGRLGFVLEPFGGREYAIFAAPDNLYGLDGEAYFYELLDGLTGGAPAAPTPEALLAKVATAACKAAVKGNQGMSRAEAQALIEELLSLENPYHCPHGRPTMISMSKREIEKKFKRII